MKLQNGDMPDIENAIDLGTVPEGVAPATLENRPEYPQTEELSRLLNQYKGTAIPPHRRVYDTIRYYRDTGVYDVSEKLVPYRVNIPGLGTLYFQRDRLGWGDDFVVLGTNGEVMEG